MDSATHIKILNVDDDDSGRYATSRVLRHAGFTVSEASSGGQALRMVSDENPYIVLLDVNLPDIDGFEVCRRIKANPATARIPVLQMSATYVDVRDRAHGLEEGADGYLVEPIEPAELIATVNAFVRLRKAEEALRASARQWQAMFDAINDGVGLLELNGTIMRCNRSFAGFFLMAADEICGKRWNQLPDIGSGSALEPLIERMLSSRRRESVSVALDGRTIQIAMDPAFDLDDRITGAVCILSDITARVQAEHDLTRQNAALAEIVNERADLLVRAQQARSEAEEANRLKDQFIATVSHELRTPLNSILGWTNLMRGGRLDAQGTERAMETVERNAKLQAKLIDDLLDASRLMSGKLHLEKRPVEIGVVLESAVDAVQPQAEAKDLRIESRIDTDTGMVLADPGRLHQIFSNLLSNSVKFTPAGGGITVRLERAGSQARISVRDTGPGISAEFLPHVFESFRQGDNANTRSHGGLGLGLSIVKNLVELHEGMVRAESEGEGKGATFTVELPLIARSADAARARTRTTRAQVTGIRVLVVDDELDTRELLTTALGEYGAEVIAVPSVAQALEKLLLFRPDVLVSDIDMPKEDGYALIASLGTLEAKTGHRISAIALTGHASADDRRRALLSGFHAHVGKPVEPLELARLIQKLAVRSANA
jgi:PAS domain S-box-containing protein